MANWLSQGQPGFWKRSIAFDLVGGIATNKMDAIMEAEAQAESAEASKTLVPKDDDFDPCALFLAEIHQPNKWCILPSHLPSNAPICMLP